MQIWFKIVPAGHIPIIIYCSKYLAELSVDKTHSSYSSVETLSASLSCLPQTSAKFRLYRHVMLLPARLNLHLLWCFEILHVSIIDHRCRNKRVRASGFSEGKKPVLKRGAMAFRWQLF